MTVTLSTSTHLGHPIDAGVPCSGAGIARRFERTVPVTPDSARTTPNPARTSPILHPPRDPPPPDPPTHITNLAPRPGPAPPAPSPAPTTPSPPEPNPTRPTPGSRNLSAPR